MSFFVENTVLMVYMAHGFFNEVKFLLILVI